MSAALDEVDEPAEQAAEPMRPLDEWRACGRAVDERADDRGCACPPHGPSATVAVAAVKRLEMAP